MNEQTLSLRLERVAANIPQGARLADIGSDHGYLPIALYLRGMIEAAVAGEAALAPFHSALGKVRKNGLQAHITVRHANGLAAIDPGDGITTVAMCGMGGETIRDILEAGRERLRGDELLVLQPNVREWVTRGWLAANGYRILHEELVEENQFTYEIIVAQRGDCVSYSPEQLYFGPLLMAQRTPLFLAKWQLNLQRKERVVARFERAREVPQAKREEVGEQLRMIRSLLA